MSEAEKQLAKMLTIKDLVDDAILNDVYQPKRKQIKVVYLPENDAVYVMNYNRAPF
jgi:hypothetical protein